MSTASAKRAVLASLGALAVVGVIGAAPAHAATIVYLPDNCGYSIQQYFENFQCPAALELYYHQNGQGANATLEGNVPNYSSTVIGSIDYDYVFEMIANGESDGLGDGVRNNAASVYNTSTSMTYNVYVSPDDSGHVQSFAPVPGFVNFNSNLDNNGASQSWD